MADSTADGGSRLIRIIQPTYELKPSEDNRFIPAEVERACEPIVKAHLDDFTWNAESRAQNTKALQALLNAIMTRVKDMDIPRYKIVIQLSLGENMGQAVRVGSQSLWESELDRTAEVSYINQSIWASLLVIGYYAH